MESTVLSNVKIVYFHEAISSQELLKTMGQEAIDAGWAKPGYIEALITREEKFATGLHTDGVEVAIPHADPDWTNEPGMVVGVLDEPVIFQPMGGYGGDVAAKFVFMLVIPDPDAHIEFLSALSSFIESKERLTHLEETRDIQGFLSFLSSAMQPAN
jgi:PTS system galactitol-specific IIA component